MNKDRELIINVIKSPLEINEKDKIIGAVLAPMTDTEFKEFLHDWIEDIGKTKEEK